MSPGSYRVVLYSDLNGNDTFDANEPNATMEVTIASGENRTGVDLSLPADR